MRLPDFFVGNFLNRLAPGIRIAGNDKGADVGLVKVKDAEVRNNIIVIGAESRRPLNSPAMMRMVKRAYPTSISPN